MDSIGEQIRKARNAKGWTQAVLAEKMNVSRSAVANWEQGQRLPDISTLVRLTNLLACQIGDLSVSQINPEGTANETAASIPSEEVRSTVNRADSLNSNNTQEGLKEKADQELEQYAPDVNQESIAADVSENLKSEAISNHSADSGTSVPVDSTSACPSEQTPVKMTRTIGGIAWKRIIPVATAALLAVALLIWLVILPSLQPKSKGRPYTSTSGETYTIERMQQQTENIPGKAYLIVNPSVQINHGETMDYYLFEFSYHEMNGIGLTIDSLELIYFSKKNDNAFFVFTAEDIKTQYGMSVDISAYGDWIYTNGLPVQDTVYGVGELVHCTDENGEKLTFTSYIAFPEA